MSTWHAGARVLAVFDGDPCREILDALESGAFEVRSASAREAIRVAYTHPVDVVVVDVPSVGSMAIDVVRGFRRDSMLSRIGILATTSLHFDEVRDAGADVVLRRPFNAPLVVRAARILSMPASERA